MSLSDHDLISRTHAGDKDAFGQLVSRHQAAVCAVAYGVVGDLGRSEDVAQEAFVAAWRQLGELRDLTKFKAWVCGIARNLALICVRREQKARSLDEVVPREAPGPTPPELAISHEEQTLVWAALRALPDTYRQPLILFYRQEESVGQVAAALDLSEAAVKQRLARGRELLRADLAATIETALKRSAPGAVFTAAVLASLPALGTAAASAATIGGLGKAAAPAAKAAAFIGAPAIGGALSGLAGAAWGVWCSWQNARFQRERDLYKRSIVVYLAGLALFVAPFAAVGAGWWGPQVIGPKAHFIWLMAWMLGFFAASGLWIWRQIVIWRRIVAQEIAAGSPELPMTSLRRRQSNWQGRQWTSRARLFGLPLVDINFGNPQPSRDELLGALPRPHVARGWIAFGERAYGVVLAVGNVAVGGIAWGAFSIGLVAVGGFAVGGLALGGLSVGIIGLGGAGTGLFAVGGMALGWMALGGCAVAWRAAKGGVALAKDFAIGGAAIAPHANDREADHFINQCSFFDLAESAMRTINEQSGATISLFVMLTVIMMAAFIRLSYHRGPLPSEPTPRF